jgi:hypothetical protein
MFAICHFCEGKFYVRDGSLDGRCPQCGHHWKAQNKKLQLSIYEQLKLLQLRTQGLYYYEIAEQLGCTVTTVWRRLNNEKLNNFEALLSDPEAERTLEAFVRCNGNILKTAKKRRLTWVATRAQVLRAKFLHKLRKEYLK